MAEIAKLAKPDGRVVNPAHSPQWDNLTMFRNSELCDAKRDPNALALSALSLAASAVLGAGWRSAAAARSEGQAG